MINDVAAFIPLKGHSSRVPGKNLREFCGRPLFHTIVDTLHHASRVGTIYIDTDDEEIAISARTLDVVVIRRKPDLVGDDISVNLLIGDFLERHPHVEHVIQTHATNPLLRASTIDAAIERYNDDDEVTSVFGVTRHSARFYWGDMTPINHDPGELLPTQELDPLFMENSNFYVFSRSAFLEHDRRITESSAMFEIDPIEAIDIDEERDFTLASIVVASWA